MRHRSLMLLIVAATLQVSVAGQLAWVERSGGELELQEGGKRVFVYRHGQGRDCCYVAPLVTPKGVVVTDDGPKDHVHHRGLFWGWTIVESDGKKGDLWARKGAIEHRAVRVVSQKASARSATFAAEHVWVLEGADIVRDSLTVTAYPVDAGGRRVLDVVLTMEALDKPVRIAGAQENNKGYGGLSIRYAPREGTVLRTSSGALTKDEDHGRHQWVEFLGTFAQGRAGLRFTADAGNPGYPNEWCLRHYGFTGANYPGVSGTVLEPRKRVTLRYRLELFDISRE